MRVCWWLFLMALPPVMSILCTDVDEGDNPRQWECPESASCGYDVRECCFVYAEPGNDEINTETRCFPNGISSF